VEVTPAIQDVAGHGATGMGEVQADLVGATRDGPRQHQRPALAGTQHPERRLGRLAGGTMVDPVLAVLGGIGPERLPAHPFAQARNAIGHGQVGLLDGAFGEDTRQGRHGSLALGEEQYARGRRVEPVHEAQELQVAGPGPPLPRLDGVDQGPVEPTVGMLAVVGPEHPAGRLVDGQHPAVLVEDVHDGSVGQFEAGRFGHAGSNHIGGGTSRQSCPTGRPAPATPKIHAGR